MSEVERVKQSFGRCLLKGDIIARFYEIFVDADPSIEPRFANTNFDSQKQLLRQGINLAIMFADDIPMGKNGIQRIRDSHGASGLNIPAALYPIWKNSFIRAISEFDVEFTDQLREEWNRVLEKAINYVAFGR